MINACHYSNSTNISLAVITLFETAVNSDERRKPICHPSSIVYSIWLAAASLALHTAEQIMASGNSIDSDGEGHLVPEEGSGGNMEDGSVGQNNLPYLTCEEHQVLKSLGGHVAAKHMKSVREGKERPRLIGHAIRSDLLDGINDFVSKVRYIVL